MGAFMVYADGLPVTTPEVLNALRQVLGFFDEDGGYQPGHFSKRLIDAYCYADAENRSTLRHAFPALGYACWRYLEAGGPDTVRADIATLEKAT